MREKNIVLFGASEFGKKTFQRYKNKKNINIVAFSDNDISKHNKKFLNTKVVSPLELLSLNYDEIIISSMYDDEIFDQLIELGIKKELISVSAVINNHTPFGEGERLDMAHELLLFICDLFNKNSIEYHLDHGTLLGIIRDKTLLPWDKDIDFAMPSNEMDKILNILENTLRHFNSKYCKNNNWSYNLRDDGVIRIDKDFIFKQKTIKIFNDYNEKLTNGFDLDIKFKNEYNQKLYWTVGNRVLVSSQEICFPSASIEFNNYKLKVPKDTGKYLVSLYDNWKIPNKEWTYRQYANINR